MRLTLVIIRIIYIAIKYNIYKKYITNNIFLQNI